MTLANAIARIKAVINAGVKPAPDSFEEALCVVVDAVSAAGEAAETADELPDIEEGDVGKMVVAGEEGYVLAAIPTELPAVTATDNGSVLMVVEGAWTVASLPTT